MPPASHRSGTGKSRLQGEQKGEQRSLWRTHRGAESEPQEGLGLLHNACPHLSPGLLNVKTALSLQASDLVTQGAQECTGYRNVHKTGHLRTSEASICQAEAASKAHSLPQLCKKPRLCILGRHIQAQKKTQDTCMADNF